MSEHKHTPGPWTVDRDYKTAIQSGDKHVAMVNFYNSPDGQTRVSGEEHEANVYLISAAPDLLEALQTIHNRLCTARNEPGWQAAMSHEFCVDECRRMIAKAEGPAS